MQIVTTWQITFRLYEPEEVEEMEKFQKTHTEHEGWIKKQSTAMAIFTKTKYSDVKLIPE